MKVASLNQVWSRLRDNAGAIFWVTSAVALATALVTGPGAARWYACGWLTVFGLLFALTNWIAVVGGLLDSRRPSLLPPIGAIFLLVASLRIPVRFAGHSIVWIFLLDPCVLAPLVRALVALRRRRSRRRR